MSLKRRISKEDEQAYIRHEITAKTLASRYGTTQNYIYQIVHRPPLPKTTSSRSKGELIRARKEYRMQIVLLVPTAQAAKMTFCTERTVQRYKQKARLENAGS